MPLYLWVICAKNSVSVADLGYTKNWFRIYRSLKMQFCYFRNFDFSSLRMTFAKKIFGTETSNLQGKFYSKVAFHNWYF